MTISLFRDYLDTHTNATVREVLPAARFMLTIARFALKALLNGQLTCFDPIVGENACQGRAIAAIDAYLDAALLQEAESTTALVANLLRKINQYQNETPPTESTSPEEILTQLGLILAISAKMDYCFRSFLLTYGKFFEMTRERQERSGINFGQLRPLSPKCPQDVIEAIVRSAQARISRDTIQVFKKAGLDARYVRQVTTKSGLSLMSSCALFNMQAVIDALRARAIPIVLIEHGVKGGYQFSFPGSADPKQPIFVVEGFKRRGMSDEELKAQIEAIGVHELILANIAVLPQYSEDDDLSGLTDEMRSEIARYQALGHERIFKIVHTHAATKGELK